LGSPAVFAILTDPLPTRQEILNSIEREKTCAKPNSTTLLYLSMNLLENKIISLDKPDEVKTGGNYTNWLDDEKIVIAAVAKNCWPSSM